MKTFMLFYFFPLQKLFFKKLGLCLMNNILYSTETDIYVRGNQAFDYDALNRYTLGIKCADQRRNDTSEFYIYLLRNMPPYFTNLQGTFCYL